MFLLLFVWLLITFSQLTVQGTYLCNSNAKCGCSINSTIITKIVGGEMAPRNTWNWAVSLLIDDTGLCGGSILSSSWILTAAHCVVGITNASDVLVSAATNQLLGFEQKRVASSIIVHPRFTRITMKNDIALIKVSPPFDMTDSNISKICLPRSTREDFPPINSTLVAIGWELLSQNGNISETLQQVILQRIPYENNTCYPLVTDELTQFCASIPNGGKGVCFGDSGGPLMMFTPSQQWIVVGITSFGVGCALAEYSAVFTRVVYYLDWIYSMNVTDAVIVDTPIMTTANSMPCHRRPSILFIMISVILFSLILFDYH